MALIQGHVAHLHCHYPAFQIGMEFVTQMDSLEEEMFEKGSGYLEKEVCCPLLELQSTNPPTRHEFCYLWIRYFGLLMRTLNTCINV